MADHMDAWKVAEKDFPDNGSDPEKLAFCIRYAVLAPSIYNSQPWFFIVNGSTVNVYIDRRHALPVIDPEDREQTMCCAAAIFTLRLAINYFGYAETTDFSPDKEDSDLLARVKLGKKLEKPVDDKKKALFKAIMKRHTNRGAFSDKEVSEDVIQSLKSAASHEGAWLHICGPVERKAIVNLVAEADHIQSGDKHFRRELASWIDGRRAISGDGMPGLGLKYEDIMNSFAPTVARRFEVDNHSPANDKQLDDGSPVIAVLGTIAGGERLNAGQALMRVLLQAECQGLAVSMLNQPCEVPQLRLRLHDEIEHQGRAHMILRMGYGGKPSYTPRRPLSDVVRFEGRAAGTAGKAVANDEKRGFLGKMGKLFKH